MNIEHGISGIIFAPLERVWAKLGSFSDMSWNPAVQKLLLIGGQGQLGSIREMHMLDGAIIREKLISVGRDHSFVYEFDGVPPIPVSTSRTTVIARRGAQAPDLETIVSWAGQYRVMDMKTAVKVEELNCRSVWPALIANLALSLEASFDIERSANALHGGAVQPDRSTRSNVATCAGTHSAT